MSDVGYRGNLRAERFARPAAARTASWPAAAAYLAMTVGVLAAYLPVAVVPYAFSDDYAELDVAGRIGDFLPLWVGNGRPLGGLMTWVLFSSAGSIDDLRLIRLVSMIVIFALAALVRVALIRAGVKAVPATLAAILVATLPPLQVYAAWTVLLEGPCAALLAGVASLVLAAPADAGRRSTPLRFVASSALFLAALLTYQPAAMFFWVFAAIAALRPGREWRLTLQLLRGHALVGATGLLSAFALLKLGSRLYPSSDNSRAALVDHPLAKAHWFLTKPLFDSLDVLALRPRLVLAVLIVVAIVIGVLLLHRRSETPKVALIAIGVCLVPLSYLPNLVVRENWGTYRTQSGLRALVATYLVFGLLGIASFLQGLIRARAGERAAQHAGRLGTAVAAASVAGVVLLAARHVTTLFVKPQSAELAMIRQSVSPALEHDVGRLTYVRPQWYNSAAPTVLCDEFGFPSSYHYWVPGAAVHLVLRDQGRLPETYEVRLEGGGPTGPRSDSVSRSYSRNGSPKKLIVDVLPPNVSSLPKSDAVIDMRRLQTISDGWSIWTFHMQPLRKKESIHTAPGFVAC